MSRLRINKTFLIVLVCLVVPVLYWQSRQDNPLPVFVNSGNEPSGALPLPLKEFTQNTSANHQSTNRDMLQEKLQGTSLAGTDVDRSLLQIVDGQLVLNGGLLFYFDYFLTLEGEMPLADIKQLLLRDLQANYSETISSQIADLFQRYLDYLAEVARREAGVSREQVIAQHLSAAEMQNEVKRQYFSEEEIAALFDGYDALLAKPSQASVQQKNYEKYQQAIKENPEQLESVATELFGAEAAQNLRNVQYQRQQWSGRVAHYEREKQSVVNAYGDDAEGRQQALVLLQQRLFSETEMRRVQALERIRSEKK